jgi:hypothetical protein
MLGMMSALVKVLAMAAPLSVLKVPLAGFDYILN